MRGASPRRLAIGALAAGSLALAACSSPGTPPATPAFSPRPIVVVTTPPSTTGLFVSVAVDNHFHDIHPKDPPSISADRSFQVKNEGRNLHNFSVVGTDITVDLKPGQSLQWARIGDHLKPGTYDIFCKYHASGGMTGKVIVTR